MILRRAILGYCHFTFSLDLSGGLLYEEVLEMNDDSMKKYSEVELRFWMDAYLCASSKGEYAKDAIEIAGNALASLHELVREEQDG